MRRGKQLLMTVLITLALLALAWSASAGGSRDKTIGILAVKSDIPAGTQLTADQLTVVQLPQSFQTGSYLTDVSEATGQWTSSPIMSGELLSRQRLAAAADGISYPAPGPGRRLVTIDLEPADAVGFWLASGSLVDLYLIPRNREAGAEVQVLEKIRIMGIVAPATGSPIAGAPANTGNADGLICLDVNCEQARLVISSQGIYDITLSAINEGTAAQPAHVMP